MAGPGSVRRHTASVATCFCVGGDALPPAGYLSVCRGIWCNGASPAWDDPRIRRSGFIRAIQMALYSCTAVSSFRLRRVFLVGSKGDFAGRLLLGCLARVDANLW